VRLPAKLQMRENESLVEREMLKKNVGFFYRRSELKWSENRNFQIAFCEILNYFLYTSYALSDGLHISSHQFPSSLDAA